MELSKLDPDVIVESLKKSVLDLFETWDESLKSEMYTEVQKVVLQEARSSDGNERYIEINGISLSVQHKFLGKMIVNAAPLGARVQLGITKWISSSITYYKSFECNFRHNYTGMGLY